MRFMLSRRWALFALAVVVLASGCWWLGRWQFHRLDEREASNTAIRHNLAGPVDPVAQVLRPGTPSAATDEWRKVRATGTYLTSKSIVIRYQTREGSSGVDIVTPLRTTSGPSLLVDRGWMATKNVGLAHVRAPAPPSGTVTVTGYVRADGTGDSTTVTDASARAVSSVAIGRATGLRVYGGFVDLLRETPPARTPLVAADLPDLGNGPHFFYGLQWWFFGLLAVGGFVYLAYDERTKLHAARAGWATAGPADRIAAADRTEVADRTDSKRHVGDGAPGA